MNAIASDGAPERQRPALFITYDGLLDPLGGSQILPYIVGLSRQGRPMHVLSFEKPQRYAVGAEALKTFLDQEGIGWSPISFTRRFGKLGKVWDLLRMYAAAISLFRSMRFGVIHCRSYQAMQVGCLLRKVFGAEAIFDMRGLWVDERVDGGLWPQNVWSNRVSYAGYKLIEASLLRCATHVVALTNRVVPELKRLSPEMTAPVTVIPCCADFDHFAPDACQDKAATRRHLGLPDDAFVLGYLGSLGTWYMLDKMLQLFAAAAALRNDVYLLLVTPEWGAGEELLVQELGLQTLRPRIHVRPATRAEVPNLVAAFDVMLSFIKPSYSKMASSPTKLAEAFALGVPVISNVGVGDVERITEELDAGALIDFSASVAFDDVARQLDRIRAKGGDRLRLAARERFGLELALTSYGRIYDGLGQAT